MSSDVYAVCPACRVFAQVARWTAGGPNHPNSNKVAWFHMGHYKCAGYMAFVPEHDYYNLEPYPGDEYTEAETYGDDEFDPNNFPWSEA